MGTLALTSPTGTLSQALSGLDLRGSIQAWIRTRTPALRHVPCYSWLAPWASGLILDQTSHLSFASWLQACRWTLSLPAPWLGSCRQGLCLSWGSFQLSPPYGAFPLSLLLVTAESGKGAGRVSPIFSLPLPLKNPLLQQPCVHVHGRTRLCIKYCLVEFVVENKRNKNYIWKQCWSMHGDHRTSWMQHRKLQILKAVPDTKEGRNKSVGAFKRRKRQWDIVETALKSEQIWFYK